MKWYTLLWSTAVLWIAAVLGHYYIATFFDWIPRVEGVGGPFPIQTEYYPTFIVYWIIVCASTIHLWVHGSEK